MRLSWSWNTTSGASPADLILKRMVLRAQVLLASPGDQGSYVALQEARLNGWDSEETTVYLDPYREYK